MCEGLVRENPGNRQIPVRQYRLVRQIEEADCGAAALATIVLHYGTEPCLAHVRELSGTNTRGTNLLELANAAEHLGFTARGVEALPEALLELDLPAIAHFRSGNGMGHFVVIFDVDSESIVVGDPASGIMRLPRKAFFQHWSGYLLLILPSRSTQRGIPGTTGRLEHYRAANPHWSGRSYVVAVDRDDHHIAVFVNPPRRRLISSQCVALLWVVSRRFLSARLLPCWLKFVVDSVRWTVAGGEPPLVSFARQEKEGAKTERKGQT